MSEYTVYVCDRCGAQKERDLHFTTTVQLPIPTGHITRIDCFDQRFVNLCKTCHQSFNYWWKKEIPPPQ